jgi:hypothetical protein
MLLDIRPPRGSGDAQPWHDEPYRVAWRDQTSAFQCLILRGNLGALCGYVRVPRGHRLHGKRYQRSVLRGVEVHGGLTFSGCIGGRRMKRGHWFGFDCAHWNDLVPGLAALGITFSEQATYRTVSYVRDECAALAQQLARKG